MTIDFVLNGARRTVEADPGESLMDLLRRLGLKSVKNGCDDGYCGACAVLLDGRAVNACLVFAARRRRLPGRHRSRAWGTKACSTRCSGPPSTWGRCSAASAPRASS